MKTNILKKMALISIMSVSAGILPAHADQDVDTSTNSSIDALMDTSVDSSIDTSTDASPDSSILRDYRNRGRRDRGYFPRYPRYPQYPQYPNYPQRGYSSCYDHELYLTCKVNGRHQAVTGYTNCGVGYQGSYCYSAYVPGYRVNKMNVTYRCEYGRWQLQDVRGTGCSLSY